jgi:signal transduction histidine kinase
LTRAESPVDSEDAVEFYSDTLPNGMRLQVGKDTDDREELLGRFRDAFAVVIGLALFTALASSLLLSRTVLRPIQRLIGTVEEVRKGNLSARAIANENGDEINSLAKFLNGMLAQNSKLISALTESLDAVAHDLRTPLTRLRVHAERALSTNEEAFGAILENTDQVIELLNAILDVSEANAGTLAVRRSKLNLRPLLLEVIDMYSVVAEERKITLAAGPIGEVEFEADIRIKQAVANLIDNAIKFSPPGSTVQISARFDANEIVIGVQDQGPGITTGDETKIWDRLYRGDTSRTTRGMGLGLSLVRSIVLAHDGEVSFQHVVEHGVQKGSLFEIRLPRSKPA